VGGKWTGNCCNATVAFEEWVCGGGFVKQPFLAVDMYTHTHTHTHTHAHTHTHTHTHTTHTHTHTRTYMYIRMMYVYRYAEASLNNRFVPYDLIRTEAVLSMDDDFRPSGVLLLILNTRILFLIRTEAVLSMDDDFVSLPPPFFFCSQSTNYESYSGAGKRCHTS
jgi:hypothetical protein